MRSPAFVQLSIRSAALSLSIFALLNLAGEIFTPGFNANDWWIIFPAPFEEFFTFLTVPFAFALGAFALHPAMGILRQHTTRVLLIIFATICAWNALVCFQLHLTRQIHAGMPLPLSTFIAALLFVSARMASTAPDDTQGRPLTASNHQHRRALFALSFACLALFALLQMFFFGKTDYRRPADAIVVFGARTYADGRLSDALTDRVRTGCDLYLQGYAPKLIFSGGPGDGATHETEAMKKYALAAGVAEQDILLDPAGLNTHSTVANTKSILAQHQIESILCVSHFYHLPRVKLTYQRAGIDAYTVPARESEMLARLPLFLAREVAALAKYYLTAFEI
jgi:uncharacterized SAM-binding protein YcdF (DUF218 family)